MDAKQATHTKFSLSRSLSLGVGRPLTGEVLLKDLVQIGREIRQYQEENPKILSTIQLSYLLRV